MSRTRIDTAADRWEHGSYLPVSFEVGQTDGPWQRKPHTYWGSGRDALRALVEWGVDRHGWRRLLVPSYYCQEVLVPLVGSIEMVTYQHGPTNRLGVPLVVREGEIALVVSLFGTPLPPAVSEGGVIVEDHTHDPLSPSAQDSVADYAFASLRKTLPVPDGGVIWSPTHRELSPEAPVTLAHDRAAIDRLAAMVLKHHYLTGANVAKEEFRSLAERGEATIGQGGASGMSSYSLTRIATFPAREWRDRRASNLATFRMALGDVRGATLLDAPFAAVLLFDTEARRDRVRRALIRASIYPTVYWPLEDAAVAEIPESEIAVSHRILSLHCDYRYGAEDMERVALEVRRAIR